MNARYQRILTVVLELDDNERAKLADDVLRSLDAKERKRIESVWFGEARRRFEAYDRGEIRGIRAAAVFESLNSKWRRVADERDRALDADPTCGIDGDETLAKLERGECP